MAPRNPFRKRQPKARPFVTQVIGQGQHEPQGGFHPGQRQHRESRFGTIEVKEYHRGSSREYFPAIELKAPRIGPKASVAEQTLNERMIWLGNSTEAVESRMDVLQQALKTGKMWRMGQEPGFRGVSYGPDRSRHAKVPVLGLIPGVNYVAGLTKELFTGRFWLGSKSRMQKLNSFEINSIRHEIERLKGIRESYVGEFEHIGIELERDQGNPRRLERFALDNFPVKYRELEGRQKSDKPTTVVNVQNVFDAEALREEQARQEAARR